MSASDELHTKSVSEKSVVNGAPSPSPSPKEEIVYPKGFKLVAIVLALCLAVFLVALDQTIIATAIPRITDRFNSVSDIGWYGSVRPVNFPSPLQRRLTMT